MSISLATALKINLTLTDGGYAAAKGFQYATDVALRIIAQPDQAFAGANEGTQPLRLLAAHMGRRGPARSGELRQTFGVGGARLVQPRRQALVCFASVDAVGGQLFCN